jgi:CBS domain-containing protein
MLVQDILKQKGREIYSVEPDETVYNAIAKMADLNIGALLVMQDDQLRGIISERDYRNKVILKGRKSKTTDVRKIMTDQLHCVDPKDTVNYCMMMMTEKKIRHLPVLNDEKVIGVISIGDVVKSIIDKQEMEISSLRGYISGGYPG